jgi:ribonuclease HI
MRLTAYVDGGGKYKDIRPANIGVYITDEQGDPVIEEGYVIGDATNNEAEYSAVLMAIYHAKELGATSLEVFSDSRLVVNQIHGSWKVNQDHIGLYYDEVMREKDGLDFSITWIPRSENQRADKLARSAILP